MLKRADWRALQESAKDASEPEQLEFSFAPDLSKSRDLPLRHPGGDPEPQNERDTSDKR
jgi:hypothetical protein